MDDEWEHDACPDCGAHYYCECGRTDRPYDPDDDLTASPSRYDLAYWFRDVTGGAGNLNAIARHDNPHGVGLGGYPWQKRANKRRLMQLRRRMGLRSDWSPF